jgi:hypothetical protein
VIVNVWFAPQLTLTAPDGVMVPPAPADALMIFPTLEFRLAGVLIRRNWSPLSELPAKACAPHALEQGAEAVGAVTVTCIFQVLPPALIPGMLAKATVAGPVSTGVPPDTVPPIIATGLESDHPVGAMRRSELIVDTPPTGVWFVKVNVSVCVVDGAMEAGNPSTLNCFWEAALLGNANAASIVAIKKQNTLRRPFIVFIPPNG